MDKSKDPSIVYCAGKWTHRFFFILGALSVLITSPAIYNIPNELEQGNHLILIALLFPIAGIAMLYSACKYLRSWNYYGSMPLKIDPFPGQLSGDIAGCITLNKMVQFQSIDIKLECVKKTHSKDSSSEYVEWQKSVLPEINSTHNLTQLRFAFQPPQGLPASREREAGSNISYLWRLTVNADDGQHKINRIYIIPVAEGSQKTNINISEHHLNMSAALNQNQANEDIHKQINLEKTANGFYILNPAWQAATATLPVLLIGLFFSGIGYFLLFIKSEITLGIIFGAVGLLLVVFALIILGRSLEVVIEHNTIYSKRAWMGIALCQQQLQLTHAKQITCVKTSNVTHNGKTKEYFKVIAKSDNKTIKIAQGIANRETAEYLVKLIQEQLSNDQDSKPEHNKINA